MEPISHHRLKWRTFWKILRHTRRFTATYYYVKASLCPMSGFKQNNIFLETSRKFYIKTFKKNVMKFQKGIIHHWFTKVPCKTFLWNLLVVFRPLTWRAFRLNPKVKTVWMGQLLLVNWLWMHLAMNDWVFAINTSYSAFVKKATVLSC